MALARAPALSRWERGRRARDCPPYQSQRRQFSFYWKNGKVKVSIAVGKGKQQFDKREDLKKRDADRELKQATMRRR